ncbi:hypothetical protein GA0111570_11276 [Raineyella antarctica]|uniref:Uncharacterized protein n=1 Tax=Raineyella antarctica TaxID=1577474 RepID=A0A1G6HSI9_9ACTN|nr:hypothetical protein [Raineyella antarctica]SDB97192.1 hypothetical protein GA0111570_11276 [Raineyella antarctica]
MTDDPMDREDDVEQAVIVGLRRAPLPPMPEQVREQLDAALRDAQLRRETGECAQDHTEAVVAAALRTATGTFGPNPIGRKTAPGRRRTPRTIGA